MSTTLPQLFSQIDWALLREQKRVLVAAVFDESRPAHEVLAFEGILSLIDSLQDLAVDQEGYPADEVYYFPPEEA